MSIGIGVGDFIKIIELVTQARKRFVDAPSQYNDIANEDLEEYSQRSSRIQQHVHHLAERSNQQEQNEILQWIGTVDHGSHQSKVFDEHEEGTGEWLLHSDEFRKWIETKGEKFLCPGLPGAGKTFMASVVIHHLLELFGDKSDIGIAYHYCDFRRQDGKTDSTILASILKQLAQCLGSVPDALRALYDKHKAKGTRPSLKETTSVLGSVASLHSRVFIVIDGLDECLAWRAILAQLRGLKGANVLITSRAIPEILNHEDLKGSSILEIRASDADVREYLDRNMSRLGGSVTRLKIALAALPTGSSAYDETYLAAMERIERQNQDDGVLAKDVLSWLTFAKRPLQIAELRAAVVIQETDSDVDKNSLIDINDLVLVCAGLVTVDKRSQTVSLIHYTTQEYLERTRTNWRPDADAQIATSCLTYLLFPVLDVEFLEMDKDSPDERADRQLYPLLDYSKEFGALHARLALSEPPSVARFFSSESKMPRNLLLLAAKHEGAQSEATAEWLIERGVCIDVRDADRRGPLHYAVLHGWKRCVQLLLQRGASLDPDIDNMTPFHYTVKKSDEEIAQAFLDAGTPVDTPVTREIYIPVYQNDRFLYVPRAGAQDPGLEARTEKDLTALHLATLTGNRRMTKFLLDHGADPNFPSEHGQTPLHLALRRDLYGPKWPGIVDFWNDPKFRIEVILDHVEFADGEDEYCSTLAWIHEVRLTIVHFLLEHPKVGVNAQDVFGISSLHIAARGADSTDSLIQKLIEKGAKISVRTKKNETPLHLACLNGNLDAVTTLLTHGADPMDGDVNGLNALHYAAKKGHLEMMQKVVGHVSDTSVEVFLRSKDNHGENVLHHLLSDIKVDITAVRYLLTWPIGMNDLDNAGMFPMVKYLSTFVLCVGRDDAEVLHLMFESGANPAFETEEGLNLAHLAAGSRRTSVSVFRTLARWGVDLRAEDKQGRTVIHYGAIEGQLTESILHFLCHEVGLSEGLHDAHGKTALDYAVEMANKDRYVGIFDGDRWGRTEKLLRGLQEEI
ncbi:hypothetical protein N0V84_006739 [Fusarium piperis]|uniref:Ankyrin n=1 Tax=Fusarium piperis TaxID=1435070 RepID=A0A9W8WB95_9HYPO|nr:hypothetical protein N0V84_006739 [Fusarium piperis]